MSRHSRRPGVWPFIPAGFPHRALTADLLCAAADGGASGIEVGFPFSDSIADGPVIQEAFAAALANGVRVSDVLAGVADARSQVAVPLVGMVSASIVYSIGVEAFMTRARESGLDGLIVPDLSLEEAPRCAASATANDLRLAMLVAPVSSEPRRRRIAAVASGFLYYVAVRGVTGARESLASDLAAQVENLRTFTSLPILVGFGVSTAAHVRAVCEVADGAIVGSAIVRRMLECTRRGGTSGAVQSVTRDAVATLLARVD
ncbi:MAG: tryptophan synthase subunit alpha [Phycisphaerae bacterium]|nr:tryptophan synthase subunit alpha [Phycisphaerae bacterium]